VPFRTFDAGHLNHQFTGFAVSDFTLPDRCYLFRQSFPFARSDCESKIQHLNRLKNFWTGLLVLEFSAGLFNLGISVLYFLNTDLMAESPFPWVNFLGGLLCTGIGIVFLLTLLRPVYLQIRKLRKEQALHD